ncbi:MAG: RIP metalloprotease RseP [Alphaproteobacteria bacterium]
MNIAELIQMVGQNIWIYGGSFVLVLSILVFVHEWGHYIIARMCGVRVEKFSIGFGKEIYGFNDKSGTRWKISMIPLGGYVQLFGDTDPASAGHSESVEDGEKIREMTEAEREVAFFTKPVWQRAAVVFAGPAINYIFAILILAGLFAWRGQPVSPPVAAAVVNESAAFENGFQPHDYIVSINGKTIDGFGDISREMMVALDQEQHFVVRRGDELVDIYAKPERKTITSRLGFKSSIGILGLYSADEGILVSGISAIGDVEYDNSQDVLKEINNRLDTTFEITIMFGENAHRITIHPTSKMNTQLGQAETIEAEALYLSNIPSRAFIEHTAMTAVQSAIRESYVMTRSTLEALGQMVTGTRSATELGGIVRIGAIAGEVAQQGVIPLILLAALLSINLGLINLLPIPMLDGGHLTFYAIESIIGRPVPEIVQEYAFRAGFVFLIGIMAFANLNDVYQIINAHS